MSAALAIFVKTPDLSPVKTRLAAAIGRDAAQRFHRRAADRIAATACAVGAVLTPYWAVAEADGLDDDQWQSLPRSWQGEGDLGARMARVYDTLLDRHGSALLIGADVPQVTPDDLIAAIAAVQRTDNPWVLGPAADGGFWLVGGHLPIPIAAWRDTPWSQPDTAVRFASALESAPTWLRTLRDVDSVDDLEALRRSGDSRFTSTSAPYRLDTPWSECNGRTSRPVGSAR